MIRIIPDVLDADGVARLRAILDAADWIDGNETSGPQAALAKRNQQLPEFGEPAVEAGRPSEGTRPRSGEPQGKWHAARIPLADNPAFPPEMNCGGRTDFRRLPR